jgi:hypothetical protein
VTIAIAAKSAMHECIVTVSDRSISFDDLVPSLDNGIAKDWFIGKRWGALFAANDTSFALPIIRRANELLKQKLGLESFEDVKASVCDAYAEIREEYITRQYLGALGFKSLHQFRIEGAATLGEHFIELVHKVEADSLEETTLLVYGYEPHAQSSFVPRLFEVRSPGTPFALDHLPYFAIGSGANIAMASLNLRPVGHLNPAQLVYRVLEAKFAAEASSSVGRSTSVLIANRGEPTAFLTWSTIERIRRMWEESRIIPPPDEINKLIVETPPIPIEP